MSTDIPPEVNTRGSLSRRAGWNLVDQAISSLGSAVSAFLIARAVGIEEFGVFGICFATLNFLIGMHRALGSQAYAIRYPLGKGRANPRLAGLCLGVAGVTALVAAPFIVAGAFLLHEPARVLALIIFAVLQPFLLMQDGVRSTLLAQGRPRDAAINDAVTTVIQLAGGATGAALGANIDVMIALWCGGAVVGSAMGWQQLHTLPRFRGIRDWLRDVGHVGWPLAGEWLAIVGASQMAFLGIGAIAGVVALGSIRAAQTLLGPVGTFGLAVTAFALPHLSAHRLTGASARRYAWILSIGLGALAGAWGLFLLALPSEVGVELLGDSWTGSQMVLVPLLIQQIAVGLTVGPNTLLAAMSQTSRSFQLAIIHGFLLATFGLGGALLFDVRGATFGFALASSLVVPVSFWQLGKGIRDRRIVLQRETPDVAAASTHSTNHRGH
jgi:O-antigen/teichoic acid export membrane protein